MSAEPRHCLSARDLAGAVVAALGIVVLAWAKVAACASGTFVGFLLAAALAWASGNVIAKRMAAHYRYDGLAVVVWSSLVAPIPRVVLSLLFEGGLSVFATLRAASVMAWASVLFLAWGATLFCYVTWNRLLHRYPTALIAPFALLVPVSGLASGAILLGESLTALQAIGGALVFAGLAITVFGPMLVERAAAR